MFDRRAFLAIVATPGLAQEPKFKAVSVKTPDGLTIAAQVWGNPSGPEIVFIHGFSTKQNVTDTSGRGVGLDAVRRNLLEIGGRVTVSA